MFHWADFKHKQIFYRKINETFKLDKPAFIIIIFIFSIIIKKYFFIKKKSNFVDSVLYGKKKKHLL